MLFVSTKWVSIDFIFYCNYFILSRWYKYFNACLFSLYFQVSSTVNRSPGSPTSPASTTGPSPASPTTSSGDAIDPEIYCKTCGVSFNSTKQAQQHYQVHIKQLGSHSFISWFTNPADLTEKLWPIKKTGMALRFFTTDRLRFLGGFFFRKPWNQRMTALVGY